MRWFRHKCCYPRCTIRYEAVDMEEEIVTPDLQTALADYERPALAEWMEDHPMLGVIVEAARRHLNTQTIVNEQAEDEGLWFRAITAPEAYLQEELRRLHAAIEETTE